MSIKSINESFKKLYEDIDADKIALEEASKSIAYKIQYQLEKALDELKFKGESNIKSFEIAFQNAIEEIVPDKAWWEVTDCDIFGHLFTERNPDATIEAIISRLKPEYSAAQEPVEESLDDSNEFEDFKSGIYNAIMAILFKWRNKPVGKDDVEKAIEWFLTHYTDDDMLDLEECANRLDEADMSDEDKHDSALIRSMLDKMNKRSNAAFSDEEKAVLAKYGMTRTDRNLSINGRDIDRRVDNMHPSYFNPSSNGDKSKINYADRARKLGPRKANQVSGDGSDYYYVNDDHNAHGRKGSLVQAERNHQDAVNTEKINNMKYHLGRRKYAQKELDTAASTRDYKLGVAQKAYDDAVRRANDTYDYTLNQSGKDVKRHQDEIDKLLRKSKTQESLTESLDNVVETLLKDYDEVAYTEVPFEEDINDFCNECVVYSADAMRYFQIDIREMFDLAMAHCQNNDSYTRDFDDFVRGAICELVDTYRSKFEEVYNNHK